MNLFQKSLLNHSSSGNIFPPAISDYYLIKAIYSYDIVFYVGTRAISYVSLNVLSLTKA